MRSSGVFPAAFGADEALVGALGAALAERLSKGPRAMLRDFLGRS